MIRHAIATFATILLLGGCQYNGTFDLSGLNLPLSKDGDELICKNDSNTIVCNRNDSLDPKTDPNDKLDLNIDPHNENYYLAYGLMKGEKVGFTTESFFEIYGSKSSIDAKFDNEPNRAKLQGKSGLFIDYNSNMEDSYYMLSGGDFISPSQRGTNIHLNPELQPNMPTGTHEYNGIMVAMDETDLSSGFRIGTVKAGINFNVYSMWMEFAGTGIALLDNRFDDLSIDEDYGFFSLYRNPTSVMISGTLLGKNAEAMEGKAAVLERSSYQSSPAPYVASGSFIAERNSQPVVTPLADSNWMGQPTN